MVIIQNPINDILIDQNWLVKILQQVLIDLGKSDSELLIRIVDKAQIQKLNNTYRHQNKPTNVLAFPFEAPIEIDDKILGDVIICTEIVSTEAQTQNKTFANHLIHLAVHGTLHLLGYNHINDDETQIMQALEAKILQKQGFENPY